MNKTIDKLLKIYLHKEALNYFLTSFSIFSILTIYLTGNESWKYKSRWLVLIVVVSIIAAVIFSFFSYQKKKKGIKIIFRRTEINCRFEDIFSKKPNRKNLVIIPVDRKFTINNDIIPQSSIQGEFIKRYGNKIDRKKVLVDFEEYGYYKWQGYILIPIVKLSNQGKAEIKNSVELIKLYAEVCEKIEIFSKKKNVIVPLIGSNLKINNNCLESEKRLKLLIDVIKLYDFKQETKIRICLNKKNLFRAYDYLYF